MNPRESEADPAAAKSRRTAGGWFYVSVILLIILLNLVSFASSLVDGSTRTVPLPLASVDLTHTLIHPVSLWGAIGVFTWLTVFFVVIVPTSAWRDFAAWSVR